MKNFFTLLTGAALIGLIYWTYSENYRTRDALKELRALNRELVAAQSRLAKLEDEWAYQNRPERLRVLVDMADARLGLLPMNPDRFGRIDEIAFPAPLLVPSDFQGPVITSSGEAAP